MVFIQQKTTPLTVVKLYVQGEITQYRNACEEYLRSDKKYKTLNYPDFPNIKKYCPICSQSDCAIWKGYYVRRCLCVSLFFLNLVVIRRFLCKNKGITGSFLPDFLYSRWVISLDYFMLIIKIFHLVKNWESFFDKLYQSFYILQAKQADSLLLSSSTYANYFLRAWNLVKLDPNIGYLANDKVNFDSIHRLSIEFILDKIIDHFNQKSSFKSSLDPPN